MKKKIIIVVFVLLFVSVGLFVYVGQKNQKSSELFYSGTIEATQARLSFQVPGRISIVNVEEGQAVKKDQIIAELDRAEFAARYEQARGNLDRSQKAKQQMETVLEISKKTLPAEVSRAEAGLKSARDSMTDAAKNYRRFEELFHKEVVSEKERDALKLQHDVGVS